MLLLNASKSSFQNEINQIHVDTKTIDQDIKSQTNLEYFIFGLIALIVLILICILSLAPLNGNELDQNVKMGVYALVMVLLIASISIGICAMVMSNKNYQDGVKLQKDIKSLANKAQVQLDENATKLHDMISLYAPITTDIISDVEMVFFETLLDNLYKLFLRFKAVNPNLRLNSLLEFSNFIKKMRGYMLDFDYQSFSNNIPSFNNYIDALSVDLISFKMMLDQIYQNSITLTSQPSISIKTLSEVKDCINLLNSILPKFKTSIDNQATSINDIASDLNTIASRFSQNYPNYKTVDEFFTYIDNNLLMNTEQMNVLIVSYNKIISGPATLNNIKNLLFSLESKLSSFGFNYLNSGTSDDIVSFLNNTNLILINNADLLNELLLNLETDNILNLRDILSSSVLMFRNLGFMGVLDPNRTSTVLIDLKASSYNSQLSKFSTIASAINSYDISNRPLMDKNTDIFNQYLGILNLAKNNGIANPTTNILLVLLNNMITNTNPALYDFSLPQNKNLNNFSNYINSLNPNAYIAPLSSFGAITLSDVQQFINNIKVAVSASISANGGGVTFSCPSLTQYSNNIFAYLNFLTNFFNSNLDFFQTKVATFINSVPDAPTITPSSNWSTLFSNIVTNFNNKKNNGDYLVKLGVYNNTGTPIFELTRKNLFTLGQDGFKASVLTQKIDSHEKELLLTNNTSIYLSDYPIGNFDLYCLANYPTLDPLDGINVLATLTGNLKQSLSFYLFFSSWYKHSALDYLSSPSLLQKIIFTNIVAI